MSDPNQLTFPGGFEAKTYRFDTPDQMTLPLICSAKSVSARIGYDDKSSAALVEKLLDSML